MREAIAIGFSPCPNDTFMFWAWVHGAVPGPACAPWLADIEALNLRAIGPDPLPVSKVSAALLPELAGRVRVATAGAALGRGCGPLVVARAGAARPLAELAGARVAIPGHRTTAALLLRAFAKRLEPVPMRFDAVALAVARGDCEAGVLIHEERFTYAQHGLELCADLGAVWEQATGLPLPLGVVVVRREVARAETVVATLRASVETALADPDAPRAYVREHARELDAAVCAAHIALYVNEFSVDVGREGRAALEELVRRAGGAAHIEWVD